MSGKLKFNEALKWQLKNVQFADIDSPNFSLTIPARNAGRYSGSAGNAAVRETLTKVCSTHQHFPYFDNYPAQYKSD